jgi:anaerobic magnesium-protoporphyrin IX monomethyl ester cyclase
MRVLLVNSNRYLDPLPVMPMGLCAVASALEQAGHEVLLLDLALSINPRDGIARSVAEHRPQLVGVSVRNIDNAAGFKPIFLLERTRRDVILPLKEVFSGPIVLGGPSMGISAPECLSFFDLGLAVRGDGERAMVALAQRLQEGAEVKGVPGLVVREGGAIVADNPPDFVEDLDRLPWPRPQRHLDLAGYRAYGTPYQLQTKRGCALRCSYCTYRNLEGATYRLRSPQAVADEVEEFVRETGIRRVEIVDSTFNAPLPHAKACLAALADKKLDLRLSSMGFNPRYMDEEFALLMKRAGFVEASFGVEAGCDATLAALGKDYTVEHVRAAARAVRAVRIPTIWFLLLGAPGETLSTVRETLRTIDEVAQPWDLVNVGIGVRLYCGSQMSEDHQRAHGRPADNFLKPLAYQPEGVTLERIKAEVATRMAFRPNYLMYEDQAPIPLPVQRLFHRLFPRRLIWRAYIGVRRLAKASGLFLLVRVLANRLKYGKLRD